MAFTEKGMTFQRLDEHRKRALTKKDFDPESGRFIILSDAHKWDRGEQDYFNKSNKLISQQMNSESKQEFSRLLRHSCDTGTGRGLLNLEKRAEQNKGKSLIMIEAEGSSY